MNFTDVREAINFTANGGGGDQIMDGTFETVAEEELAFGDNVVYNQTEVREFWQVWNYRDETRGREMLVEGLKCLTGVCAQTEVVEVELEEGSRLWSDPANWPNEQLPQEGDDVIIESGWNMYLDIEETPVLNSLEVNGRLTFLNDDFNITLKTKRLYVRAGELYIGTETEPFKNVAKITLVGNQDEETFALSPTLEVYNKNLVNVGKVAIYGKPVTSMSRLSQSVFAG